MDKIDFETAFEKLTGYPPFPWQCDLYTSWFAQGKFPDACTLPTGLGKTSVIAVWLIALANGKPVPRRLVYVVNRRTVVDQTTDEVEHYRESLSAAGIDEPLAISTLRGQFADNREWNADPSRPAVICGTVDMIGSRLLFSGYGIGFKGRPLHAGFLGQDTLIVHDEAHLEKPFQDLLVAIACEQRGGRLDEMQRCVEAGRPRDFKPLQVIAMTATPRGGEKVFELTPDEKAGKVARVRERLEAKKRLAFHRSGAEKGAVAKKIGELAAAYKDNNKAVLVFVRTVEDVGLVEGVLTKTERRVLLLTGTLRGKERDDLAGSPEFGRFKKDASPGETIYLVCTSAGEVGVDISADHLVCDLTPFDSMAQRFGRVNRYGSGDSQIDVVCEPEPTKKDDAYEQARWKTLQLLQTLPLDGDRRDASPKALGKLLGDLPADHKSAAFTPTPRILPTSDILFDAWALTTVRDRLPGRPHVEPYLHGIAEWEPPETHVAWRREVEELPREFEDDDTADERRKNRKAFEKRATEILEDYPVKPLELLREPSYRAFKHLSALAERNRHRHLPVWLLDDDGTVQVLTLGELADKDRKDRIDGRTVLLPPSAGGLSGGRLDGTAKYDENRADYDVADEWKGPDGEPMRKRVKATGKVAVEKGWRLVRSVVLSESDDGEPQEVLHWLVRRAATDEAGATGQSGQYPLDRHNTDAAEIAAAMVKRLGLPDDLAAAVTVAAGAHDLGKDRDTWQRSIGNGPPKQPRLAKSGHRRPPEQVTHYRHEFGSLLDVANDPVFQKLSPDMQELALHLIAAHHGRGRPHFPAEEAFDPEPRGQNTDEVAAAVPRRFARLQRKYGRWGLAYLESLVRAADILASQKAEGGGA